MRLKDYQKRTLQRLQIYLESLRTERDRAKQGLALKIKHKWDEVAWENVMGQSPYKPRKNGMGEPLPSICLKVPTAGGKTLLAVNSIDVFHSVYRGQQTGMVLWVVPSTTIYNQTLRALRDRAHPYRTQLDLASNNRTIVVQKEDRFTPEDIADNLVILLLMLPSANKQVKDTLRLFRDRGGFESFFPAEDAFEEHEALARQVPNLDRFDGQPTDSQMIVKSSLGNVLRLLNPLVIVDEGHKAYSQLAKETVQGFNPALLLELSATPTAESNLLVSISGQDLLREGMIKLDVHVHNRASVDWRDALLVSHQQRLALEEIAIQYRLMDRGDYIRPICLIQVERTGESQKSTHYVHAEDARNFLMKKCGVPREQIAVKSSERDEIEEIDLLDDACPIRYIITKYALQEGWDCSFAYVLTVLTNPQRATTSIAQLMGRILRQPYARKTGRRELDESYVFCSRENAGELVRAVRAGLNDEGLGDVATRVVADDSSASGRIERPIREHYRDLVGRVYLPCFVIRDLADGEWREVGYESDVLSRIDWKRVDLSSFETIQLNPEHTQDSTTLVGLDAPVKSMRAVTAVDMPLDPIFMARQISDMVPNPWQAYDYVQEVLKLLRLRYTDERIRRDLAFIIEEMKRKIARSRIKLAKEVFEELIDRQELRFLLLAGDLRNSVPEQIDSDTSPPLTDETGGLPLFSLFDYRDKDVNNLEKDLVLYLEKQCWVMGWLRNFVRIGYSIQGWHQGRVYPDFVVFAGNKDEPVTEFRIVYVLETKGLHLQGSEDTEYKKELFELCNRLCKPTPWDEMSQSFSRHGVQFQLLYEDQWRSAVNELAFDC